MPVESGVALVSDADQVELGPLPVDDRRDDVSIATGSALNGGSSVAVNMADLDIDAVKPDPAYLTPPRIRHPLDENVFCAFSVSLLYYLFGLFVGVPIFSLLLCALAVAVPVRLICLLYRRWSHPSESAPFSLVRHICDPWWPVQSARHNVRAVVTLQRAMAASDVADQLTRRLTADDVSDACGTQFDYFRRCNSTGHGRCCGADWPLDASFQITDHVRDWASVASASGRRQSFANGGSSCGGESGEEAIRLDGIRDLQDLLNGKDFIDERKSPWSVVLVPSFGNYEEGTGCSLALIDLHPRLASHVCTHRLVSLWTDGSVFFDIEPKLRRPMIGLSGQPIVPPYSFIFSASHGLWTVAQFICGGPLSFMTAALRRCDPVWTRARRQHSRWTSPAKRGVSVGNKYRVTSGTGDRRKGSSLCGSTALMGADGRSTRRVSWMRIANADQVLRAERILRAATVELMLAFVAGALRRHFRSQGIRHPPDVRIALPISYREYMPVEGRAPCETVLVPMKIPTSVEGNIPRVWDVQRRLADAFDDAFPNAVRAARCVGDLLMPYSWYQRVLGSAYSDSACILSFFRVSGDMNVHARKLQSMLFYPSVPDRVQAAWTFIQCGTEMMVSLSVDGRTFPNPDTLLVHFKAETQSLLNQLSVRLLTLSQATFLPPRPPLAHKSALHPALAGRRSDPCHGNRPSASSEHTVLLDDSRPDATERSSRSPSVSQTTSTPALNDMLQTPADQIVGEPESSEEREATLEELERLLATVQSELDMMRDNPQGDRAEYVAKLTELERRMEAFHRSIAERLGPAACKVHEDVELASSAVASLLAPYRDENASSGRRFSREFLRRDSKAGAVIMRKQSKRVESPTRRVSPKISSIDLQHLQQP